MRLEMSQQSALGFVPSRLGQLDRKVKSLAAGAVNQSFDFRLVKLHQLPDGCHEFLLQQPFSLHKHRIGNRGPAQTWSLSDPTATPLPCGGAFVRHRPSTYESPNLCPHGTFESYRIRTWRRHSSRRSCLPCRDSALLPSFLSFASGLRTRYNSRHNKKITFPRY